MATYASLTDEQKDQVQSVLNAVRSAAAVLANLANQGQAIGAAWDGGIATLVNGLDPTEVIPQTSGLAGAQPVAPADLINFAGYLIDLSNPSNQQASGGYNTPFHQALRVKLCGVNAAIGR